MVCALNVSENAVSSKSRRGSRSGVRVLVLVGIDELLFCKFKGKKNATVFKIAIIIT